jgi:2,4-dienoyl-CoA reductase-like NADH-dependent reductase (Old Yellow Enzyme family)
MSILLSNYSIGQTTLANRIVISPMCQYSAIDGFATNWHLVHLGSRATAGLVIQEATAVSPEGRISYADLGLWSDAHIPKLKEITDYLHSQGSKAGIQLAHAGRKASCEVPWLGGKQIAPYAPNGWQTVGPYNIPFRDGQAEPVALSTDAIAIIVQQFAEAAKRSVEAGYDVIEIHAAHGYLLHQFYSPLSNQRTDAYGGSFENRIRFLLQVVDAVKTVLTPHQLLFVRISATDWVEGGWSLEDSVALSKELKEHGVHLIDVSTGGNVMAQIPLSPGYQVPFATAVRKQAAIPTGAVGLITTPEQGEAILQNGEADLIFIARESLRNPQFPLHAAKVLGDPIPWPRQYERAG